jgi:hypothetical protein
MEYTVYAEVKNHDILAVKDNETISIEMKKSFNATLLMQAVQRQKTSDGVYIAIPHPGKNVFQKKWHKIIYLIKRLELGLIVVKFTKNNPRAEISFHPKECTRYKNKKQKTAILREVEGRSKNYNIGGSSGSKLVTAYRENSIHIACCLDMLGPMSAKNLRKTGTCDKTYSILYNNFYGWFEKVEKGVYSLHSEGKKALIHYKDIAKLYYDNISKNQ